MNGHRSSPDRHWRQRFLFGLCAKVPLPLLATLAGTDFLIPYYHVVTDESLPHVRYLYEYKTVKTFREDIDFLLRFYSPIGLHELLASMKAGRPLPDRAFMLTFDNGYRVVSDLVEP